MSTVIGQYFTVAELAQELEVTPQRVHAIIRSYNVRTVKPHNRLTLIPRTEADRLKKMDRPTGKHRQQKK